MEAAGDGDRPARPDTVIHRVSDALPAASGAAAQPASPAPRTARPARARSLTCPSCGSPVTVRAAGSTVTAVCPACSSVLDVANEDVRLIAAAAARTRQPLIAIGTRGALVGTEWEVVGYQERSSADEQWEEYLLFNPYRGFRFLSHGDDTWILYVMLREAVGDGGEVPGDPHRYQGISESTAKTDYVLGEFYWRVKVGDSVLVHEYTGGPYWLSQERSIDEVTWSRGITLDDATVRGAFGLSPVRPEGRAAGAANRVGLGTIWLTALVALVLLGVLGGVSFGRDHNRLVTAHTFSAASNDDGGPPASELFEVPDSSGNLTIDVTPSTPIDWLDANIALVSEDGNRRFDAAAPVSLFRGQNTLSYTFASVPGGEYKLLAKITWPPADTTQAAAIPPALFHMPSGLSPGFGMPEPQAAPAPPPKHTDIGVTVRRHTYSAALFGLAFLAILSWPVIVTLMRGFARLVAAVG
jgi:Domain of unknown function (DUF4178)